MLYSPSMLASWLQNAVLYQHLATEYPQCNGGIILLNDHLTRLNRENLYLGDCAAAVQALTHKLPAGEPLMLITAGTSPELERLKLPDNVTVIAVDQDLLGLYNRVQFYVHKYLLWESELRQTVLRNSGLQSLLDAAFDGMQTTLLLMNAGYKLLAGCFAEGIHDSMTDELKENGYLSFEAVQYIVRDISKNQTPGGPKDHTGYVASQSGLYTTVWPIEHGGNVIGRLVVVLPSREPRPGYVDLSRIVAHYLGEYMLSSHAADYSVNTEFGSLAADLIECRLTDPEELEERLKQTHLAVKRYYHVLLISFPALGTAADSLSEAHMGYSRHALPSGNNIPWNFVISQLEQVFPFSNITVYQNEILMLVRKTASSPRMHFNQEPFLKILRYYNGYAAIGNFSKFLTSLAPIYRQTRATIRLATAMQKDPEQRIFYYEDYSIYQTIELAAMSTQSVYGTSNMIYLCHPALISLLRYDRKNGTNLCDVLFAYLTHDRNAAETARVLFLHRNTMLYKIGRIEEILGQSLDNMMLRSRLLYSYHVIEYVTRYLHEDILILKRNLPEEETTPKEN